MFHKGMVGGLSTGPIAPAVLVDGHPDSPWLGYRSMEYLDRTFRRVRSSGVTVRYAAAMATVVVGVALTIALQPFISRVPSSPLFAAVLVTAWLAGFGPSVAVTLLGALALGRLGDPTISSLADVTWVLPFVLSAVLVSWLASRLSLAQNERNVLLERAQKAMTDAEAANRAKDEFLAMVSHELRTPLTAALGWLHVLRTRADPADLERAVEVIDRNMQLQARLIEELLDASRITTGRLDIRRLRVDLARVARHVAESLAPTGRSRDINLDVAIDGPVRVLGDESRLEQLLTNLVSNAIKFTPPAGRVEIELRQHGDVARLTVRDSGIGIDAALLPHIFEPFRQGKVGLHRDEGLGLGLAIVKHLVTLHEGAIQARSSGVGHGATFVVELPIAR